MKQPWMNSIVFWVLAFCITYQVLFILLCLLHLNSGNSFSSETAFGHPVSIVICVHNEQENLKKNLPAILNQQYPQFEVIVVDDASTDGSAERLTELQNQFTNLKLISIPTNEKITTGKKQALIKGVKAAKFDYLLLTDADCKPVSSDWIAQMMSKMNAATEIVLGYSPILKGRSLLDEVVRYENLLTAALYFNFAAMGLPYMGVGRNIAYRKKLLLENLEVFNMSMAGGDDDLTVNQLATSKNTAICINKKSWMETSGPRNWRNYFRQKKRHFSVSRKYTKWSVIYLFLWNFTKVLSYLGLILGLTFVLSVDKMIYLAFVAYLLVLYIGTLKNTKVLGNRELLFLVPFLDALSVFFNSFVVVTNLFSRKIGWK